MAQAGNQADVTRLRKTFLPLRDRVAIKITSLPVDRSYYDEAAKDSSNSSVVGTVNRALWLLRRSTIGQQAER